MASTRAWRTGSGPRRSPYGCAPPRRRNPWPSRASCALCCTSSGIISTTNTSSSETPSTRKAFTSGNPAFSTSWCPRPGNRKKKAPPRRGLRYPSSLAGLILQVHVTTQAASAHLGRAAAIGEVQFHPGAVLADTGWPGSEAVVDVAAEARDVETRIRRSAHCQGQVTADVVELVFPAPLQCAPEGQVPGGGGHLHVGEGTVADLDVAAHALGVQAAGHVHDPHRAADAVGRDVGILGRAGHGHVAAGALGLDAAGAGVEGDVAAHRARLRLAGEALGLHVGADAADL